MVLHQEEIDQDPSIIEKGGDLNLEEILEVDQFLVVEENIREEIVEIDLIVEEEMVIEEEE